MRDRRGRPVGISPHGAVSPLRRRRVGPAGMTLVVLVELIRRGEWLFELTCRSGRPSGSGLLLPRAAVSTLMAEHPGYFSG